MSQKDVTMGRGGGKAREFQSMKGIPPAIAGSEDGGRGPHAKECEL